MNHLSEPIPKLTAVPPPGDLSPVAHSASTPGSARSEPCVCGGVIEVCDQRPNTILTAVQLHNQSLDHRTWQYRMGIE